MDVEGGATPDDVYVAVRPSERTREFGVQPCSVEQVKVSVLDVN